VGLGHCCAGGRGGIYPFRGFHKIHRHTFGFDVDACEFELCANMALFRCLTKKAPGFQEVLIHASAFKVAASQSVPRLYEVLLGGD